MTEKFKFEFFDLEQKKIKALGYDPTKKFASQTEAWLDAVIWASEIARKNQWILLEIETYFIGKEE